MTVAGAPRQMPSLRTWEDIARPSVKVGGATGTLGLLSGSIYGIYRSRHPAAYTIGSGAFFGFIGLSFWTLRTYTLHHIYQHDQRSTPIRSTSTLQHLAETSHSTAPDSSTSDTPHAERRLHEKRASTIAGVLSGGLAATALGRPRAILPGAVQFGLVGLLGQHVYNYLDDAHTRQLDAQEAGNAAQTGLRGLANRWRIWEVLGLEKLSDADYRDILQDRIQGLEVEIDSIEAQIRHLKEKPDFQSDS